jgi:frataxin-like iron-binding protein CyaY
VLTCLQEALRDGMVDCELVDIVQNRACFVIDMPTSAKDFWLGIAVSGYRFVTTRT